MFAPTIEAFPRVGEVNRKDLNANTGNEALASSRISAVHVAMARNGKAFGLAGVLLVDRNLDRCEQSGEYAVKICDYLCRHKNQLYTLTRVKAPMAAPTTAQYILSKVNRLGTPSPLDMSPMDMSIPPMSISMIAARSGMLLIGGIQRVEQSARQMRCEIEVVRDPD